MSLVSAEGLLKTAVGSVVWTIPPTASLVENATATSFTTIHSNQTAYDISADMLPYCRIHVRDLPEYRETTGGDLGSFKRRDYEALLWVYWQTFAKNWDGGGDFFKSIVDGTMRYFRQNSAPIGQQSLALNSDVVISWGLKMRSRIELPELFTDSLYYRATISVDVIEYSI